MAIRILIVDDHGVLRAGLRALLDAEPDMVVVGDAADGCEALRLATELHPDIVLLDISLPGKNGIEITQELKQALPDIRVLILTVHEDESLLREAIRAGALGYIVKRAVESELIDAIRAIWHGDMYVHPTMTRALLQETLLSSSPPKTPATSLTPREIQVLQFIGQGYTNRQAAELLGISTRTVESHRASIMGKLDLHSRVELVQYARAHGLLE